MKESKMKTDNRRRYYLHFRTRKSGYVVNTSRRFIHAPASICDENKYVKELVIKFKYKIQYTLL